MAIVELIYDVKPLTYIAANPTKVLSNGEPIYYTNGQYSIGDGTTQLSSLPLYGGTGYTFTGTTSQYTRGDGTYATFPTNVSSFTNDSGYITSSALSPYLTIANAALTYQPLDSDLTSWAGVTRASGFDTFATTPSSANLKSLVTDETGTGALVFGTSPTFTTDITINSLNSADSQTWKTTTHTFGIYFDSALTTIPIGLGTNTNHNFGFYTNYGNNIGAFTTNGRFSLGKPDFSSYALPESLLELRPQTTTSTDLVLSIRNNTDTTSIFNIGNTGIIKSKQGSIAGDGIVIRDWTSVNTYGALYFGVTPGATNYILLGDATNSYVNGGSTVQLRVSGTTQFQVSSTAATFNASNTSAGAVTNWTLTCATNTGQTASTNIPNFKVTGSTKTWAAGTLATQYFNYFSANTVAFASASTATNVYGLYVEAATAGTNATITNNYAAGFSGGVEINGQVNIIGGTTLYLANTSGINIQNVGSDRKWASSRTGGNTIFMNHTSTAFQWYNHDLGITLFSINTSTGAADFYGGLTVADAKNIILNSTTGTKIGTATTQKLAFWNATPIVQPTTAVAAATFVANTSAIANDTATFDGYTIGQIVKALRNAGLLA